MLINYFAFALNTCLTDCTAVLSLSQLPTLGSQGVRPCVETYSEYPLSPTVSMASCADDKQSSSETTPNLQIEVDDSSVMDYIWERARHQRQLKKYLGCENVQWDGMLLEVLDPSSRYEEYEKKFAEFSEKFTSRKLFVSTALWEKASKFIDQEISRRSSEISCIPLGHESSFNFVGAENEVVPIFQHCANKVSDWTSKLEEETSEINETLSLPSDDFLKMLQRSSSYTNIPKEVRLSYRSSESNVILEMVGPKALVMKTKQEMEQTYRSIGKTKISVESSVAKLLGRTGLEGLNRLFSESRVDAVATEIKDGKIQVITFPEARDRARQMTNSSYVCLKVDKIQEDQIQSFLRSQEYTTFVVTLCKEIPVIIEPDHNTIQSSFDSLTLSVTGETSTAHKALEALTSFLTDNVVFVEVLDLEHPDFARFAQRYQKKDLDTLITSLKSFKAEILLSQRDATITVKATKRGINLLRDGVKKTVQAVTYKEVEIEKHGLRRFFESRYFLPERWQIERDNRSLISIEGEEGETDSVLSGGTSGKLIECCVPMHKRKRIALYKGDICRHNADAIVNAANEDLKHSGGVAKHIADSAGRIVIQQCAVYIRENGILPTGQAMYTDAGRLGTTSHIIHTVGPKWPDQARDTVAKRKVEKDMKKAIRSSLELATHLKCRSVAFPAVSSGIYGCPSAFVAKHMVQVVTEYLSDVESEPLAEVHFVLLEKDSDNIRCFTEQMSKTLQPVATEPSAVPPRIEDRGRQSSLATALEPHYMQAQAAPKPARPTLNVHVPKSAEPTVKVHVKDGDITDENVSKASICRLIYYMWVCLHVCACVRERACTCDLLFVNVLCACAQDMLI